MGRPTLRSNTIDEQAAIETMGIGCKRKRLLLFQGKKEEQWMERETKRGQDGENGKRGKRCDEALYGGQKGNG